MTRLSRAVREQVSQRAAHRCEYCRLPEAFSFQPYQIDHIRALKHGGSDKISNLAWACADCNNAKGSDQGSYDPDTDAFVPFFNPRTQNWKDHFEMRQGIISGKTPFGRVTAHLFKMNRPQQVEVRHLLIEADCWD